LRTRAGLLHVPGGIDRQVQSWFVFAGHAKAAQASISMEELVRDVLQVLRATGISPTMRCGLPAGPCSTSSSRERSIASMAALLFMDDLDRVSGHHRYLLMRRFPPTGRQGFHPDQKTLA